jgi:RimJ/RimL family protein N-acetyltransferase
MRIVLETRRLVLAELSMADLDFMASMVGDRHVMRYYPKVYCREEAAAGIRLQLDRYARDGIGAWLARDKSSGRPVGRIGLMRKTINGVVETEIAWMIHRPYQRCGYASEGAAACRDHALTALGLPRVIALVRPENVPSRGVATKIGLRLVDRTLLAGFEHLVYATQQT